MSWIKRNLAFVISLAVAAALLIGGAVFLFSAQSEAEAATGELEAKKNEYDTLVKREPYPNAKNIDLAKAEQARFNTLKTQALATFSQYPSVGVLDDASFKALLTRTISDLEHSAERKGVKLPTGADSSSGSASKYNFTFNSQRRELRLPPNTLQPLVLALTDIREFTELLFASKIHSLLHIKRSPIGTNELAGSGDILSKKVSTNTVIGAGIYPYEVQFQCFSSELGDVLTRFVGASNAYVLKTLNVDRPSSDDSAEAAPVNPAAGMMAMMSRYGLRPGMGTMPPSQANPSAPAPSGKVGDIVLEQKPIKVTLGFEVVRLASPPTATQAPKATRR
ncbi:MAG: Amuc_1100 family pilus-like protein [Verrucomicrobia bacterium]|jgi:hypothetical protein|nr:Amuc_1100 family pilus-like protein [Verrucomicrobiota bacterium]